MHELGTEDAQDPFYKFKSWDQFNHQFNNSAIAFLPYFLLEYQ